MSVFHTTRFSEMNSLQTCWLLVFMLMHCRLNADDDFPWATVNKVLDVLCPSRVICGRSMGWNGSIVSELYKECCTGCSCEENCEETQDCCFPENTNETIEKPEQISGKCMHPRSKHQINVIHDGASSTPIYIVDSPPANGCVMKDGIGCEGDDILRLLPVSSSTTGTVYYNRDCALCHGEGDVYTWKAIFNCDYLSDMAHELTTYINNPEETQCFFSFLPNDFVDRTLLKKQFCRIKASMGFVNTTYYGETILQSMYNVSHDEMGELCFTNFSLPYFSTSRQLLYRNPFCYLYDGGIVNSICEPLIRSSDYSTGYFYKAFIDYSTMDRFMPQDQQKNEVESVCYKQHGNMTGFRPACRPLLCPKSHLLHEDGNCVPVTNLMMFTQKQNFSIQIRLVAIDNRNTYNAMDVSNVTMADIESALPFLSAWKVMFVGYGYHSLNNNNSTYEDGQDLLVCLHTSHGNLSLALDEINRSLAEPVVLTMNRNPVVFTKHIYRQALSPILWGGQIDLAELSDDSFMPGIAYWLKYIEQVTLEDLDAVSWSKIHVKTDFFQMHSKKLLTKLHFCRQVELTPDEFTMHMGHYLLIQTINGAYFYDNEFQLIAHGMYDLESARVCFKDAGFERLSQGCNFPSGRNTGFICLSVYGVLHLLL